MEFRFQAAGRSLRLCSLFLCLMPPAFAAPGDEQFLLQQQRQQALEQQLTPQGPDVRLSSPVSDGGKMAFPLESPCFEIHDVTLTGQDALPHWVPLQQLADQAVGNCLGAQGINQLMGALQNRLISHGVGSAAGYGIGKSITWGVDKITSAVGKWVTNGWDPKYDPTWIKYSEVNRNDIIREGMKPNNVPGSAGDIGGSIGSELGGKATDKVAEEFKK